MTTTQASSPLRKLYQNIAGVIVGKDEPILLSLVTLLCRGHLLIEDVPGVGKTMLARALARSISADFKRIQCTPDLLPSDVTGVSIYNQKTMAFEFMPGPVFTNLLLADEINRATPRTQSSLLECMGERQVSIDGTTHALDPLFMVIATQNPVEYHGTFPLPEAQLDRFFMCIAMGYPSEDDEVRILRAQNQSHPIDRVVPVMPRESLLALQERVSGVTVDDSIAAYIARVVRATREHPDVELGASPRGSLALMKASQAMALLSGKDYVTPQVVKRVATPVLAHRIVLKQSALLSGRRREAVVGEVLSQVPVPVAQAA